LSELYNYTIQDPPPADVESVKAALRYLEACHKLFEMGLLSHEKVCDIDSKVVKSIKEGFSFFVNWHASLSKHGKHSFCTNQLYDKIWYMVYSTGVTRFCVHV